MPDSLHYLTNEERYPFTLPPLPYAKDALVPHVTEKTFSFHHEKHHQAYVTNLNNLIKDDASLTSKSLEEIIKISAKDPGKQGIFNNAAQVWNHAFFWHSMNPKGGGEPSGKLNSLITDTFGDYAKFKEAFKQAGVSQFGSGWVWLVLEDNKLKITKTSNADLPMNHNQKALLTADVWEHAYYLDYQNRRPDYLGVFLDHLVDWKFAEKNLTD